MTTHPVGSALSQYLTFTVADGAFAVPVLGVREILEYSTITDVPQAPDYIRGVVAFRGQPVPVMDLAVRFGRPPSAPTKRACIVVVETTSKGDPVLMGLLVDGVTEVTDLGPEDVLTPPPFGPTVDLSYMAGFARSGDEFVLLLDVERVFSADRVGHAAWMAAHADESAPHPPDHGPASPTLLGLLLLFLLGASGVHAEGPIQDNSFLLEEAYNQERGVVQHINTFTRANTGGDWIYTLTQEWPVPDEKHQLSFTLPAQQIHLATTTATGVGDIALNYRYQVIGAGAAPVAFAPRVSGLLPTGRATRGLGSGGFGLQVNLPVSWAMGRHIVTHWNAGATHTFGARTDSGGHADASSYALGQSLVWLLHPKLNLLIETSWVRTSAPIDSDRFRRTDSVVVSPGLRWAFDFSNGLQVVPGVAFPIGVGASRGQNSLFLYLSFEHPFRRAR